MNGHLLGWGLALAAHVIGYVQWGWRGVVLALTVTMFWLLLQFSRALRAMRQAGQAPKGTVASAVMLNARLRVGMRLLDLLPATGSLGEPQAAAQPGAEAFAWRDAQGDTVVVELQAGRLQRWRLVRAAEPAAEANATTGAAAPPPPTI